MTKKNNVLWLASTRYGSSTEASSGKNPVFTEVTFPTFMKFISRVFKCYGNIRTPWGFARTMATRTYNAWDGRPYFCAIPTSNNGWGWMYQTISGRQLIWMPWDTVYTRGLQKSKYFLEETTESFGRPLALLEPNWLEKALTLAITVHSPCIGEYGKPAMRESNKGFFAAIKRNPRIFYYAAVEQFKHAPEARTPSESQKRRHEKAIIEAWDSW